MFSEVVPSTITAAEVREKDPQALVLSGGPSSVYAEDAPQLDPEIFELGLPIFGICLGHQMLALALGARAVALGRHLRAARAGRCPRRSSAVNRH